MYEKTKYPLREALDTIKLITEYPSGYCPLRESSSGGVAHIASDLTLEEPYVIDRYGLGDIARDCLIALVNLAKTSR